MNNYAELVGKIVKEPEFDYESHGKKYYMTVMHVERLSGVIDKIPLMIPEDLMSEVLIEKRVYVSGQFSSYMVHYADRNRLLLYVFVNKIEQVDSPEDDNLLFLDGFICKEPILRENPNGRWICDLMIAVSRNNHKFSDYIPTIVWGRNARYAGMLSIGTNVRLYGRIQSREYQKIIDGQTYIKTAYEFSASVIEVYNEDKDD